MPIIFYIKGMKNTIKSNRSKNNKDMPISYLDRYRQAKLTERQFKLNSLVKSHTDWNQDQIQQRRDKIIQNIIQENEVSRIRIEEQLMDSQFFKDDYLDLQILWLKKVDEIKEQTHKLKVINSKESKIIQSLRNQMEMKQQKLRQLEGRMQENNRNSQDTAIGDDQSQSQSTSRQQLKIIQQNQNDLMSLQKVRQNLVKKSLELQANIKKIKLSINGLEPQVSELQNRQKLVKGNKEALLNQLKQLRAENKELERIIQRDFRIEEELDQDVREYIELTQNVFIINELEKLQELMIAKQQQEDRKQIFIQNSKFYKQKCKELQTVNSRVKQNERIAQKLTFQIKQKSIQQLNLYSY